MGEDRDPPDKSEVSNVSLEETSIHDEEVTEDVLITEVEKDLDVTINTKITRALTVTSPSPPPTLKNQSFPPRKIVQRHTPPTSKDYRKLYQEVKRRLFEQAEIAVNLEKKYEEELAKQLSESNKRENILNADLSRKDDEINNLRVSIKAITT